MNNIFYIFFFVPFAFFGQSITIEMFNQPANTGANMTVGVNASKFDQFEGGQIGAFYDIDGNGTLECVGLESISTGFFGLALWGDDLATDEVDGLLCSNWPIFALLHEGHILIIEEETSLSWFGPQISDTYISCGNPNTSYYCEFESPGYCTNSIIHIIDASINGGSGCTDVNACNAMFMYSDVDYTDDGSCDYNSCAGCTDAVACNFDADASIEDGSCDYNSCAGCTDAVACNFDADASIEDGSCEFADYWCEVCENGAVALYDADGDSYCDLGSGLTPEEVVGCQDVSACNYETNATDPGSCIYFGCTEGVTYYGDIGDACNSEIEEVNLDPMIIQYSHWEDYASPYPGPSFESAIGFNVITDSLILNLNSAIGFNVITDSLILNLNIGNIWFYGGCILDVAYANVIFSISIYKDGNLLDAWDYNSVGGSDGCMMGPEYTTISSNINFPDQILVTQGNYELIFEVTESFFESASLNFSLLINDECVSYGCNDTLACNYNPVANVYDNSCNYIENNCLCETSCPNCQNITLPVGWSIFSSYMIPNSLYFDDIMTDLNQNNQIIIAKDYLGNAYLPEWNFNGIGDAIIGNGYLVKTSENCILNICGDYAYPESNTIFLNSGWNIIGYLRTEPANISLVFEEFTSTDNLIIAKDYLGNAFLPEWEFNGIGDMYPGQGYQLKINQESYFSYISNEDCYNESNYDCDGSLNVQIGDEAFGGIVFYIDSTGQHGLVASEYDVPDAKLWGCEWEEINGADGEELGTGLQNSLDIETGCDDENIAAKECLSYSFNNYDDWYLPSIDELELMRNIVGQGGVYGNIIELNNSMYWSSSEVDLQFAKRLNAATGTTLNDFKGNFNRVRPIRSF